MNEFVRVPKEPTEEMWTAGRAPIVYRDVGYDVPEAMEAPAWRINPTTGEVERDKSKGTTAVHVWRAMIAAAPKEEVEPVAWMTPDGRSFRTAHQKASADPIYAALFSVPLYASPSASVPATSLDHPTEANGKTVPDADQLLRELRAEVLRVGPILMRLQDSPLWGDFSAGAGVATLNGLTRAMERARAAIEAAEGQKP